MISNSKLDPIVIEQIERIIMPLPYKTIYVVDIGPVEPPAGSSRPQENGFNTPTTRAQKHKALFEMWKAKTNRTLLSQSKVIESVLQTSTHDFAAIEPLKTNSDIFAIAPHPGWLFNKAAAEVIAKTDNKRTVAEEATFREKAEKANKKAFEGSPLVSDFTKLLRGENNVAYLITEMIPRRLGGAYKTILELNQPLVLLQQELAKNKLRGISVSTDLISQQNVPAIFGETPLSKVQFNLWNGPLLEVSSASFQVPSGVSVICIEPQSQRRCR